MHDAATIAEMRRLYYGEHWKIGTIAAQLQVHPDAIRRAVNRPMGPPAPRPPRPRQIDPFLPWLRQTLATYPRLRATVLHRMLRERGYTGGVVQLRRLLRQLRPPAPSEAFGRLQCLPGEEGQVDWADFGYVQVGRAKRRLSAFVLTLSYSRALYAELFFDQSLSNFLAGHQHAFESFGGVPPQLLSDNLRSVVLERRGDHIRFHPRYLEWAGHYCFQPRPCHVRRGNEKGRVERSIRFLRESFWAAQGFTGLAHCNARLQRWIGEVADARPWPDDPSVRVAEVFNTCERLQLLPLPAYRLDTSLRSSIRASRAGGDLCMLPGFDREQPVSIRASRAGGDAIRPTAGSPRPCFNPRLPRGRRRRPLDPVPDRERVSIRASRAGGDLQLMSAGGARYQFQSAPPAREATFNRPRPPFDHGVSIRASRAGGDASPRPGPAVCCAFQSAPPAREATRMPLTPRCTLKVSIRASRAGGDFTTRAGVAAYDEFQSAPPAREATRQPQHRQHGGLVSIRASRAGGDAGASGASPTKDVSIRASRAGGDYATATIAVPIIEFQSAPPAREATCRCLR